MFIQCCFNIYIAHTECYFVFSAANREAVVDLNTVPLLLNCLHITGSTSDEALDAFRTRSLVTLLGCVDHCGEFSFKMQINCHTAK